MNERNEQETEDKNPMQSEIPRIEHNEAIILSTSGSQDLNHQRPFWIGSQDLNVRRSTKLAARQRCHPVAIERRKTAGQSFLKSVAFSACSTWMRLVAEKQ